MTWFLVERRLPGMTLASLSALQRALREATHRLSPPSAPMRYLGSIYLPGRGKCLCLFEADHVELVRAANDTAQAPFSSIHEAVALF
ncbi:MAG TPA: nickel-binding protein [Chloroflexota bacterium]|nr:nickel-binding protein [Chloroflexota bacterium]